MVSLLFFLTLNFSGLMANSLNEGFIELGEGRPNNAIKLWTPIATAGDKIAQASLGLLYQTGQGTPVDYEKANKLLVKSAKQGYPFAFTALGNSFYEGLGVKKDVERAMVWFLMALDYDPNAAAMANMIGTEMSQSMLANVQKKAIVCRDSKYRNCGYSLFDNNENQP